MKQYQREKRIKLSTKETLQECSQKFEAYFWALLWFCYRQQFLPLLQRDFDEVEQLLSRMQTPPKR